MSIIFKQDESLYREFSFKAYKLAQENQADIKEMKESLYSVMTLTSQCLVQFCDDLDRMFAGKEEPKSYEIHELAASAYTLKALVGKAIIKDDSTKQFSNKVFEIVDPLLKTVDEDAKVEFEKLVSKISSKYRPESNDDINSQTSMTPSQNTNSQLFAVTSLFGFDLTDVFPVGGDSIDKVLEALSQIFQDTDDKKLIAYFNQVLEKTPVEDYSEMLPAFGRISNCLAYQREGLVDNNFVFGLINKVIEHVPARGGAEEIVGENRFIQNMIGKEEGFDDDDSSEFTDFTKYPLYKCFDLMGDCLECSAGVDEDVKYDTFPPHVEKSNPLQYWQTRLSEANSRASVQELIKDMFESDSEE